MPSVNRLALMPLLAGLPLAGWTQAGPSEPQIITASSRTKINIGPRPLAGQLLARVEVDAAGQVTGVTVTENTTAAGFEPQIIKVLQNSRFRPAIDVAGKPVPAVVDMKVELRPSTGATPKPSHARQDPQLTDKEKARIQQMTCADFTWEWNLIREQAEGAAATEFMPRIATALYAAHRTAQGDYVDARIWKAASKALEESARRCAAAPTQSFWQDTYRVVLDEAVPD